MNKHQIEQIIFITGWDETTVIGYISGWYK